MNRSLDAEMKSDGIAATFFKGFLIGIANIIPGVSGGTFALILGVLERILASLGAIGANTFKVAGRSLKNCFSRESLYELRDEANRIDLVFLCTLLIGAAVSVLAFSFVINWALVNHPGITLAFFIGLIIPAIAVPWKMMENRSMKSLLWIIPGAGLTVGVALAFGAKLSGTDNALLVFLTGVVAISSMILPGISGSFVMLVLGQYQTVLGHLQGLQVNLARGVIAWGSIFWLGMLALGCLVGLFTFARFLSWLLKKYRNATLAFLIGLVIGSFWVLWPFKDFEAGAEVKGRSGEVKTEILVATAPNRLPESGKEVLGCGIALVAGLGGAAGMNALGRKKGTKSG